jgi:hypothetical protein
MDAPPTTNIKKKRSPTSYIIEYRGRGIFKGRQAKVWLGIYAKISKVDEANVDTSNSMESSSQRI